MKYLQLLFILLISNLIFSQEEIKGQLFPISETANYDFLIPILKDKKVVLLGEQSHGDGATFDEKVTLIKYLHEKLGFNTIVFESGLYSNYKAFKEYSLKKDEISIYNKSVGGIWSGTQSFQNLLNYVDERAKKNDTIKILGFDMQESVVFDEYFLNELQKTCKKHNIKLTKKTLQNLEKAFVSRDVEFFANNKSESESLSNDYKYISEAVKNNQKLSKNDKIIKQTFISKIADFNFEMAIFMKDKMTIQNPRDEQMAKNLIFLSELFPNEKMICWGASYHFAKNLENISYDETTGGYLQKLAEIEKSNNGFTDYKPEDGKNLLTGALPMGQFLKDFFKEKMYSIAFSSYEGNFALVGDIKTSPILMPPANSIEDKLSHTNKAFFEFDASGNSLFYSSILGNIPLKNKWHTSFDALLFIKKSYPPHERTYENNLNKNTPIITYKISGKIVDSKDNNPIPNAEITIDKINNLVKSDGLFSTTIQNNQLDKKIIISAVGYVSDTIAISRLIRLKKNYLNIRLTKRGFDGIPLSEVRIAKQIKLSATAIVQNARNNIEKNYYQNAFNQDFYFWTEWKNNDEITITNQAIIKTYLPNGMKGSNNPDSDIYGEVKQLKNVRNKSDEYYYTSKYGFAFLFSRDLILSKTNVLYKTESYILKNEGEIIFENSNVYKISFENIAPGSHSTGFGYPSPKYSSGYLLINVDDFAVVKYEHCIIRQPSETKDKRSRNSAHKIAATYKKRGDHYFINQLIEIDSNVFGPINIDDSNQSVNKTYSQKTIKSLETATQNIEVITRPVLKLVDSKPFIEDKEFWKNNLMHLENNIIEFDVCE